jgi:hypothetical protein
MKTTTAVVIALLLAGCATAPAPLPGAQTYSGEVRNWNAKNNTVTLYQPNVGLVHLKVTPDQLNGLELNRPARVQGVPTQPADLHVLVPAGPVTAVPKAPAEILELNGTVTSVSPTGRLTANTTRGPINIIVASGADQRFATSAAGPTVTPAAPVPVGTSASPTSEPGDHAVSTGRVLSVDPTGVLIVEAPSGPVQVVAANPARYRVGDVVQVRTTARTTP